VCELSNKRELRCELRSKRELRSELSRRCVVGVGSF